MWVLLAFGMPLLAAATLIRSEPQTPTASVTVDGFVLECPSRATEGTMLDCTVTNTNDTGRAWPVVAILHRSSDGDRALVRGSPLDVEFGSLDPETDIDGGVHYQGDLLIAYSRFDWDGTAPPPPDDNTDNNETANSRTVSISILDDDRHESSERFYVSLAASGTKGVGIINSTATAVFIDDNDATSSDAALSNLLLQGNSVELSLDFSAETVTYQTSVDYETTDVTVSPTAAHEAATISVNGTPVSSGETSRAISLSADSTTVSTVVTAENGSTKTYTIVIARGLRPATVSVQADGFTLECPSLVIEGESLTCTLTNNNSSAADWPVVGILHSSLDDNRALITEDLLIPDTSSLYSKDLQLRDPQTPAVSDYNYGYGRMLSGGSWTDYSVYGYEKFDWTEEASVNASRSVVVDTLANSDANPSTGHVEIFYITLAESGYTGLSGLIENKVPIVIVESTYGTRFSSDAATQTSSLGSETATVTVTIPTGLSASRLHLRYRINGSESWTRKEPASISSRSASFSLEGLSPGTPYQFEAAPDPWFSTLVSGSFTTATPKISTVAAPTPGSDSATVTVSVADAATSTQVRLRYRDGDSGPFTEASGFVVPVGGRAVFTLTGLSVDTPYEVEASLVADFPASSVVKGSFRTAPAPPAITAVVVPSPGSGTATVAVTVTDAVAATRVHLRYRIGSGAWTTATPEAVTSGEARFALTGLTPASDYNIEAALDAGFSSASQGSFSTLSPTISGVVASETSHDNATVAVSVTNAAASTRVHLRYRIGSGAWTTAAAEAVTSGRAEFTLTGLTADSTYDIEAALDAAFGTVTAASFETDPPPPVITTAEASAVTADTATVAVSVTNAVAATRVHLRYRIGSGAWTTAAAEAVTSGRAEFSLTGLTVASGYDIEAALDAAFDTAATESFTTLTPTIGSVEASSTGPDTATVTITVTNAATATRAHLRYRIGDSGAWTTPQAKTLTTNRAQFALTGLTADSGYNIEAALDAAFATVTTASFETDPPPPAITEVAVPSPGADTATVAVTVANAVAATRVHLRYRIDDGAWTTATPEAVTSGEARFALTGLTVASGYNIEAALSSGFTTVTTESFTTLTPTISSVVDSEVDDGSAKITVAVTNAVASTRVHLRYRIDDGAWTTAAAEAVTSGEARFGLTGLTADSTYNIEAAFDAAFATVTTASFETDPAPPAITTAEASAVTADTATVTVTVTDAVAATRVHLRYRIGSGAWTTATAEAVTSGRAEFSLTGLTVASGYNIEAALDAAFSAAATESFTTLTPTIGRVEASSTGPDTATVTITVTNAATATRAHLRYRIGDSGAWTTPQAKTLTTNQAQFTLTGLTADSGYNIEAALDAAFDTVTTESFETTSAPPAITEVVVPSPGSGTATVAVTVTDAVAATRVHLRYRIGSGAWTTATPEAVTSGEARFALTGLTPASGYNIEAALDAGFSSASQGSFSTLSPAISGVVASETSHDNATVAVSVTNAAASTRVHLRYRIGSGAWTTAAAEAVTSGRAEFTLTGLTADSTYDIEAALDAAFATVTTASFETDPPPPVITTAEVSAVTADTATVTVTVTDAVAATRVHLRYRIGSGAWTTAAAEAVTSGRAEFSLTGLTVASGYDIEAALDAAFAAAATESFTTLTPTISSVEASSTGPNTATVTITVTNAATATRAHLRYRIGDSGAWTTPQAKTLTTNRAQFALTGLTADSDYNIEAALDAAFDTVTTESFETDPPPPAITTARAPAVTADTATVAVAVTDAVAATRVHLRYRIGSGAWTTATAEAVTSGEARFTLTGLTPDSTYNIEAALSAAFSPATPGTFTTNANPQISSVVDSEVDDGSAKITVTVTNAVAATRVHLRYRIDDGAWTTATAEAVTSGEARFALTGLTADSTYNIEAALDATFATVTPASFETDPPPPVITTAEASAVTADTATVAVSVTNAVAATRVHLRYRIGSGAWTTATAEAVTSGEARFALTGLTVASGYNIEAALDAAFSAAATESFTTLTPTIGRVEASSTGPDTATVTITVTNAATATRAHLRYRIGDSGAWTTPQAKTLTTNRAQFALTGLTADSDYNIEAALDAAFDTVTPESFETDPAPPAITAVVVPSPGSGTATVAVTVTDAVAATRVHLRYRIGSGAWTTATPEAVTSGEARFALTGLTPASDYNIEAALDAGFSSASQGSFSTLSPTISGVVASETSHDNATVAVSVTNAAASTRVHLRYRIGSGAWTTAAAEAVTSGRAEFTLTGLTADSTYDIEAALDAAFGTVTAASFETDPPPPVITTAEASAVTADTATVAVSVTNAVAATRVHLRYRIGSGAWTTAAAEAVTSGRAEFSLTGLTVASGYDIEAALDAAFDTAATESFTTLTPTIGSVEASSTGPDTATVTITVTNAATATRAHLRYRIGDSGAWTTPQAKTLTTNRAQFALTGLTADSGYNIEAALDAAFATVTTASFETDPPPPAITEVAVPSPGADTATVAVTVANAVAATRVHLRYRIDDGAWTTAAAEAVTSGEARFALTGLTVASGYNIEAALSSGFTTVTTESFTTLTPTISSVVDSEVDDGSAKITVAVTNAVASTRVHLRYRIDDGAWTTAAAEAVTSGEARFGLTGLTADSTYNIEAAFDAAFATVTTASFETDPAPPAITTAEASAVTADTATVTVTVTDAVAATRVHLRYRIGSGAWTTATAEAVTSGRAEFSLTGLTVASGYNIEAALDAAFSAAATESFTTLTPTIGRVEASSTGPNTATVTITVTNAATATRAHLRYRIGDSGAWTTPQAKTLTTNQAQFTLTGLTADSGYNIEAALDAAFAPATRQSLRTDPPPPAITEVVVPSPGAGTATVAVTVTNAVAATRVHLRYRIGNGAWTTATPEAVTSGEARFALTGLTPASGYNIEAALDAGFSSASQGSFSTLSPAISGVVASETSHDNATVAVSVTNAAASTRVHLRYRIGSGAWTTAAAEAATSGRAEFTLTGLTAASGYNIEAALDAAFATVTTASFETGPPPPTITTIDSDAGAVTATVTASVTNPATGTRAFLRYRADRAAEWAVAPGHADVTAGRAVFMLTGLAPDSDYEMEAALDSDFSTPFAGTFTTGALRDEPGPVRGGGGVGGVGGGGGGGGAPVEESQVGESGGDGDLAQAAASRFQDVSADAYYAAAVGWMAANAITTGCTQDTFCPGRPVTRRQLVVFLWRAAAEPEPATPGSQIFGDVAAGSFADKAIGWAAQTGVTLGCAAATGDRPARFCGNQEVTRDQMSALLYRFFDGQPDPDQPDFADVDPGVYYAAAVGWMAANAITTGCTQNTYCPQRPATRAHIATFIHRAATQPDIWGPDSRLQPRPPTAQSTQP